MHHASLFSVSGNCFCDSFVGFFPTPWISEPYMSAQLHLLYLCIKTRTISPGPGSSASAPMKEADCGLRAPSELIHLHASLLSWQKALRGDYHDIRDKWVQFDPQVYHCVEPVSKGERRSIALFTPRSWKRLPAHCLDELIWVFTLLFRLK